MKHFKLVAIALTILFGVQLLTLDKSEASYHAPWYACYIEQGGSLQKCMGPYQNKYTCESKRYSIPYGSRWLGCFQ